MSDFFHIFLNQMSVDGHLGCFHVLAIINSAALNIGVHVFFQIRVLIFSRYMPRSGFLGHTVPIFLVFKGITIQFSIVAAPTYRWPTCILKDIQHR